MALIRDSDLGVLFSFLKSVVNSVPSFSSEIGTSATFTRVRLFEVVLKWRVGESEEESSSGAFRVSEKDFLGAIRALAACQTWAHAKFTFPRGQPFTRENFVPGFEDLMFEMFSLLRNSSPSSLTSLHIQNLRFCHKQLPTLLCENPCLETLTLGFGSMNFSEIANSVALCLSRNSVLKSCKITCDARSGSRECFLVDPEWVALLFRPFTTSSQSEANVNLKELVLHLSVSACPVPNCADAIANLVRCNTTLEKLEIRYSIAGTFDAKKPDGSDFKFDLGGALEANHTLKEFGCFYDLAGLLGIVAALEVPDTRSGCQLNTTLSTLNLFLYSNLTVKCEPGPSHGDEVVMILNALASMLKSNTTLKHVALTHDWFRRSKRRHPIFGLWRNPESLGLWNSRDVALRWNPRDVALRTREKLELMLGDELRLNTTLESFVVGFWALLRVGTEWQMSYEGPCQDELRGPTQEYIVKVKIHP